MVVVFGAHNFNQVGNAIILSVLQREKEKLTNRLRSPTWNKALACPRARAALSAHPLPIQLSSQSQVWPQPTLGLTDKKGWAPTKKQGFRKHAAGTRGSSAEALPGCALWTGPKALHKTLPHQEACASLEQQNLRLGLRMTHPSLLQRKRQSVRQSQTEIRIHQT